MPVLPFGGPPVTRNPPSSRIVTLTTDFGTADAYVGSMKGVLLSIANGLTIVDISHELPPHQILPAAFLLREACPRFPEHSIHVAVIDPGVGSTRRPLLLRIQNRYYIGPDNGIFGLLLDDPGMDRAWTPTDPAYHLSRVSTTFHGRDIFSPVAANLANGVPPEAFGPEITDPLMLDLPLVMEHEETLKGEVLWIDRFGNCVTNLSEQRIVRWSGGLSIDVQAASSLLHGICHCYASVSPGDPLALYGSTGLLEIALNQGRADRKLGLNPGDQVSLRKRTG